MRGGSKRKETTEERRELQGRLEGLKTNRNVGEARLRVETADRNSSKGGVVEMITIARVREFQKELRKPIFFFFSLILPQTHLAAKRNLSSREVIYSLYFPHVPLGTDLHLLRCSHELTVPCKPRPPLGVGCRGTHSPRTTASSS